MGEAYNRGFCGAIELEVTETAHPGDGACVDDRAPAKRAHIGQHALCSEDDMTQIDAHHPVEIVCCHRIELVALIDRRIVHQPEDWAERRPDMINGSTKSADIHEVAFAEEDGCSLRAQVRFESPADIRLFVEESDLGAAAAKCPDVSLADTGRPAGDNDNAVAQVWILAKRRHVIAH